MAAPILAVEQYQFRDDGITLNTDASIPFVDILTVKGLDAAPLRTTTKDHEGTEGGFVDALYETLRTVVLEGIIYADPLAFEAYVEQLKANFAPNAFSQPFYFMTDAGPRVVFGKSQGLNYTKTAERSWGKQPFTVTILCEDPRVYQTQQQFVTITVASVLGGRGYPYGYPYGYGPAVTPGSGTIVLEGSRATPGTYIMYGPIISPKIINDTLGLAWSFNNLALSSTDYLTIDPQYKTVRLNDGPSRRSSMTGRWWLLNPGTNDFRLQGIGTVDGVTKLTVSALPARR